MNDVQDNGKVEQITANSTEESRNLENFQKYWSQFDTVGLEFAYMMEGSYLPTDSKRRLILDGVESNDLKLRQWTSFLGIDMTMLELEDQFINLVNNVDRRMFSLVERSRHEIRSNGQLTANDIEELKETASKNWKWLQNLAETVQKHLANATEYHLFYQTHLQYQLSIPNIGSTERMQLNQLKFEGNYEEANDIYKTIKNHLTQYFNWWQKIEALVSQSRKLNPIELRLEKTEFKIPVTMLTDYKDSNTTFHKGEKVFRYRNETCQRWGMENTHQDKIKDIPSICCEICPPDINAIEDALLLRLDLLANWTTAIKEIGGILMIYISNILEYWKKPNINMSTWRSPGNQKKTLYDSLVTIESLLNNYWMGSSQLGFLQSRINELKAELELHDDNEIVKDEIQININSMFIDISPIVFEKNENVSSNSSMSRSETFIYQKRAINILISKYKELHKNWEMYKGLVENSSDLSFICNSKSGTETFPGDLSKSEQLLNFLSADDQLAWSKYLQLLMENKQQSSTRSLDKYPLINVSTRKMELKSKRNVSDIQRGTQNSQIEISVPGEKEMRFFQNKPISIRSDNVITSSVDISHYFTKSLLPSQQQISLINQNKITNPTVGNDLTKKFQNSSLQRSKTVNPQCPCKISFLRSNSDIPSRVTDFDKIKFHKPTDHIQSYYLILNLPRGEKIIYIMDKRQQRQLPASQALIEGLCDEYFLEILDTDTNIKHHFCAAVSKGLIVIRKENVVKSLDKNYDENFIKVVFKIDGILDPDSDVWISLKNAISGNILNSRSGLLKINKAEFIHVVKTIGSPNVRGRRIYHCNAKSLPPEMTFEIPKSS